MAIRSRKTTERIVSMIEDQLRSRRAGWPRGLRRALQLAQPRRGLSLGTAAAGAAVGAGLVYWLDPERGARRRAEVRQQAQHAVKEIAGAVDVIPRDLANRGQGAFAAVRGGIGRLRDRMRGHTPDDHVLIERVRSRIGRLSSHAGAIEVQSTQGCVRLSGPILQSEADGVRRAAWRTPGVLRVEDALEVHEAAGNHPALQGEGNARGPRAEQESWSPAYRLFSGATGLGLLAMGSSRLRTPTGAGLALAGSALLLRGLTNKPVRQLTGIGAGRRAVDLQKTIRIAAPVEEVFGFFEQLENFPRFMTHVREVTPLEDGRWRWSVTGPAGVPVSWESTVTESVPNRVLAWESVPGSAIASTGRVEFEPDENGTRMRVQMSYNPPAGAIGHTVATVLGAHPKKQLDDDLLRLKSLVEEGRERSGSETVTKDQVAEDTGRSLH